MISTGNGRTEAANCLLSFNSSRKKSETFGHGRCLMFRTLPIMNNSKLVLFLSCLTAATLAAPVVTAAGRGGGGGGGRGGFSGGHAGYSGGRSGYSGGHF